jgi:hypothetical protein
MSDMAESKTLRLVWESEYEPDFLLDLNAMSIQKSRGIAPLTNSNYGSSDKQRRPTHWFKAPDCPVLADHGIYANRAFNPLLLGI